MEIYSSGLHWGSYSPEENTVALLDPYSGKLQAPEPVNEKNQAQLFGLTKINFLTLQERLRACGEHTAAGCDHFTLPDGSVYERKDEHGYIQRHVKFPLDLIVNEGKIVGVQTASRDSVCILVEREFKSLTVLTAWEALYPQEMRQVKAAGTFMVPMRDGVRLSTAVWLPGKAAAPCILVRTPYGKESGASSYFRFVLRGFGLVIQDVRGRNESEGEWMPISCETEDGDDTLNWIAAQDWCDGSIGMIGGSYLGYVQWAAAASGNPHLKALVSEVTAGSAFVDIPRRGGTLGSGMLAWAFAVSTRKMDASLMVRDDWDEVLAHRPLREVCEKALGYEVPFWNAWMDHECDDEFWKKGDWYERAKERGGVSVPALIMSGWFDDNGMGTTQALDLTADYPTEKRKVILGPWMHSGNANYDLHGVAMGNNAIRYDLDLTFFRWFEKHLRNRDIHMGAPVDYFTLGENRWKSAEQWPVEGAKKLELYLTSDTAANTCKGGGRLSLEPIGTTGTDTFIYDPENPATHIIDISENEIEVPEDYTEEELREDYLCYTTEALTENLTITGDLCVELYLSSDVEDTDLVVRLTRVGADGRSIKLADGMLDVKYREGFDRMVWMEQKKVYPVKIRTTKISAQFQKGEKIRLTVTSSAKNFTFPNSNTREGYNSTVNKIAHNTLHHGGKYPARIICPVEQ